MHNPWPWIFVILAIVAVSVVGAMSTPHCESSAISARVDRLEKDNALQQKIITDLGDKFAAHMNK